MKYLILLAALTLAASISSCATLGSITGNAGAAETAVIEFSTAKIIEKESGPAAQAAKALAIKNIATEVKGVASGSATPASLLAVVTPFIAKLPQSDQILANILVGQIVADLGVKVNASILSAVNSAAVSAIMNDVISACTLYIPTAT